MKITEKDQKIITLLKEGETPERISKVLRLPASTVYYHVKKMKGAGIIRGYRISLDYNKEKNFDSAFVLVSLSTVGIKERNMFLESVRSNTIVSDVYGISGDWDYLLLVHGKKDEITDLITKKVPSIENVRKTNTLFIVEHVEV